MGATANNESTATESRITTAPRPSGDLNIVYPLNLPPAVVKTKLLLPHPILSIHVSLKLYGILVLIFLKLLY